MNRNYVDLDDNEFTIEWSCWIDLAGCPEFRCCDVIKSSDEGENKPYIISIVKKVELWLSGISAIDT